MARPKGRRPRKLLSLSLRNLRLLLRHLRVTSQLADFDTENLEAGAEIADHLLDESLHERNVDAFEGVEIESARFLITMLGEF
jgi:hypothetical protein